MILLVLHDIKSQQNALTTEINIKTFIQKYLRIKAY